MAGEQRRMGEVTLAEIMSQINDSVPYYVPHLVGEIRYLRQALMRTRNRIGSSRCMHYRNGPLADAAAIIEEALDGR